MSQASVTSTRPSALTSPRAMSPSFGMTVEGSTLYRSTSRASAMLTRPLLSTSPNSRLLSVEAAFARGAFFAAWTTTLTGPAARAAEKAGST